MDASQYGGWKRKENEERRQAQLSDINKKWKERKQNGYWGIVILNQNNKAVHSQTASNRDIQEPKSRTEYCRWYGSTQWCWHKDTAAKASFHQRSHVTPTRAVKSRCASADPDAQSVGVK